MLTLGSRGAVGAYGNGLIEVLPPRVDAVCPIGAGDALAAAYVWAMRRPKTNAAEALRWGVAAGTASARLPGMNFASLEGPRNVPPGGSAARGITPGPPAKSIRAPGRGRPPELEALGTACYTSIRNAPRPEVGDPPRRKSIIVLRN